MELLTGTAIAAAGVAAGTINGVVGSGTLISFPVLLSLGFPPVVANVSNTVGLVVGNLSATWGYRRELAGQRPLLLRLAPLSVLGGAAGALLLLVLPEDAFAAIVPALIALAVVLVLVQPRVAAALAARRLARTAEPRTGEPREPATTRDDEGWAPSRAAAVAAMGGVLLASVYGGYFGAAQGVLVVGILGVLLTESLQRINATKNLLTSIVNGIAALTFVLVSPEDVNWAVAGLIAAGSLVGGVIGASFGRRLPPMVLRGFIAVVGVVAVVALVLT